MLVKTKNGKSVEVPEDYLITIPEGLFGFEDYTQFALVESPYAPFIWLQSREESALAFLAVDPFVICRDYEPDIDDGELLKIGIDEPSSVQLLSLVTVPSDGKPVTANLLGPLVINKKTRTAVQVILGDSRWEVKYDIVATIKRQGGDSC